MPAITVPETRSARRPLAVALLIAAYVGFNYRFFLAGPYLPMHDTGYLFQFFKAAYANFLATGWLPEWQPSGGFGYQLYFEDVFRLAPLSYPVMAVGKLLGIGDALALFRTVVLLEIAVFGLGFLRLADELFEDGSCALPAMAALVMTTVVFNQILFSLSIVYLLPLVAYYLVVFARTGRADRLAFAAILVFAAVYGASAYFIVYYVIYGLVVVGAFLIAYRKTFRPVVDRRCVAPVAAAVLFVGLTVALILESTRELAFNVVGRDPETLRVDLDTFLGYGFGGIIKTFEPLVARPLSTFDATFYVPAAALIFAIYALIRERGRMALAVAAAFAILLVLCWGRYSPLAYAIYYVPGMSYFRHLGITFAVPKMLLCLLAGFGIRHFLAVTQGGGEACRRERRFLAAIAALGAIAAVATFVLAVFAVGDLTLGSIRSLLVATGAAGFVVVAAVAAMPAVGRRRLVGTCAAVMVVQGGAYMAVYNAAVTEGYTFPRAVKAEMSRARLYPFQQTRPAIAAHPRHALWDAFGRGRLFFQSYMVLYQAIGLDPCVPVTPRTRLEIFSPRVDALLKRAFGRDARIDDLDAYHRRSPEAPFFRIAGCDGRSKLQVIRHFATETVAPAATVEAGAMASAVLVERPGDGVRRLVRPTAGEYPNARSLAGQGIAVTRFSANRLEATVADVGRDGAWLVYADAYHPGWRAAADGRPLTVWAANLAFKAVRLPPGTRSVAFDFTHPVRQAAYWLVGLFGAAAMVLAAAPAALGPRIDR